jgi:TM2 domain-containing membrane protein YozV
MSSEPEFPAPQESSGQERVRQRPQPWPEIKAELAPQAQAEPQPYAMAQPQPQATPQMIVPKNPAVGVILSFFIPGLGSMVNGSVGRGAIILGVYALGWILTLFLIGIPILIGAWIWGLADGYLSAQRWNQARGIVS